MTSMRLIAGSGRSGTTWVQDVLADANDLRPIFEPLHPRVNEMGRKYAHRMLTADMDCPGLKQFMDEACAGKRDRMWMIYRRQWRWLLPPPARWASGQGGAIAAWHWNKLFNEFGSLRAASQRSAPLVKDIRLNLMLGWLTRHCDCKAVLVVRHPGAVLESELRGQWHADVVLDSYRNDATLLKHSGGRYGTLLTRKLSPVEALTARWVIENQLPVERAAEDGVTIVFYERLKFAPQWEWPRICRALDLVNVPGEAELARPSQQSAYKDSLAAGASDSRQPGWMKRLAGEQRKQIQGVLDEVGFTLYSMDDPDPRDALETARRPAKGAAC